MRALGEELRRRTKVIRELPKHRCPENKITPELAADRSLGLHPVVIAVDECQRWFENEQHGKDLEKIAEDLIRRGPATGITAIFATQRPDAKSLPTGISGNAVLRFCLKVFGHTANDQVLGTSAHKNGIKATIFSRSDLGIGWLSGEGDEPQITKTYYVDNPTAETIVARARAIREAAGTLSGYAIGQQPEPDRAVTVLGDLVAVLGPGEERVWSETLADRLGVLRPELYGELAALEPKAKATALANLLKPFGISTEQVHGRLPDGGTANRRGVDAEQIRTAHTKRLGPATTNAEGV